MKGSSGRISGHHSQCRMSWKSPSRVDSQRLPQQCWRGIKTSGKWPYSHLQELVNTHGKGELSSSFIKLTSLSLEDYLHGSRFDLQSPLAVLADKSPTPCSAFPTFELDKQEQLSTLPAAGGEEEPGTQILNPVHTRVWEFPGVLHLP